MNRSVIIFDIAYQAVKGQEIGILSQIQSLTKLKKDRFSGGKGRRGCCPVVLKRWVRHSECRWYILATAQTKCACMCVSTVYMHVRGWDLRAQRDCRDKRSQRKVFDIPQEKLRHRNNWDTSKMLWRRVFTRVSSYKQAKSPFQGGEIQGYLIIYGSFII